MSPARFGAFCPGGVAVVCVCPVAMVTAPQTLLLELTQNTMAALQKGEDWQQKFVFGNQVVPPLRHQEEQEDQEEQEEQDQEEQQACLRRSCLRQVPDRILKNSSLTYVCLEGNHIPSVPSSVFACWPKLQWLDLRNNHITMLPAEIGSHRCLEMLLLEGNPIPELPPELGSVITLRGLNLRDCPIRFPPPHIVQQGYRSILAYLRRVLAERSVSATKTLPVMEKLQLSDLMESGVEEETEPEDKDGLQRFRELKDQLILLDQADLKLTVNGSKCLRSELLSSSRVKKSKAGVLPRLQLSHLKRSEEKRTSAMNEMRQNQTLLEQRRKLEALEKWHTEAREAQMKKKSLCKQRRWETGILEESLEDRSMKSQMLDLGSNEDRSARKLERDIRACVESIQKKSRNPCSTTSEQMAAEAQDVEMIRKLQGQLMERRSQGKHHEKDLFSGVSWPGFPSE
nr:leucine-rich repeat-containing protein 27 isoform X1 [Nothobranchius furzeri]